MWIIVSIRNRLWMILLTSTIVPNYTMHPDPSISRVLLNHQQKESKQHVPIAVQGQLRFGAVTMKVLHSVMHADFSKFPNSQVKNICLPLVSCSLKLHNAKRPLSMKTDVIKKRQRGMDATNPRSIRVINHQFDEQQQEPSSTQQQPKQPLSSSTSSTTHFRSFVFPAL